MINLAKPIITNIILNKVINMDDKHKDMLFNAVKHGLNHAQSKINKPNALLDLAKVTVDKYHTEFKSKQEVPVKREFSDEEIAAIKYCSDLFNYGPQVEIKHLRVLRKLIT